MNNTAASLLAIASIFAACLSARGDMPPKGDITKPEALELEWTVGAVAGICMGLAKVV